MELSLHESVQSVVKQEIENALLYEVAPYSANAKQSQFGDSTLDRERAITVKTTDKRQSKVFTGA